MDTLIHILIDLIIMLYLLPLMFCGFVFTIMKVEGGFKGLPQNKWTYKQSLKMSCIPIINVVIMMHIYIEMLKQVLNEFKKWRNKSEQ